MTKWVSLLQDNDYLGIKQLIKKGADINDHNESEESVLAFAIKSKCDDEIIDLLIENGAETEDFDNEGVSIFDYAIAYNNLAFVRKMLGEGVDVNLTHRRSGFTPLMCAVCYGRSEIAVLLLEHGAKKDTVDSKGFSAADFARKMRKKNMSKLLGEEE